MEEKLKTDDTEIRVKTAEESEFIHYIEQRAEQTKSRPLWKRNLLSPHTPYDQTKKRGEENGG